jgi:hypothetical protein
MCIDWDLVEYWALTLLGVAGAGLAVVAAYYAAQEAKAKAAGAACELAVKVREAEQEVSDNETSDEGS